MSKDAMRRLRFVAMLAVIGALAVAGVASARDTGSSSGDAPKASDSPSPPKGPKDGPGDKPGSAPGGPPAPMIGGPQANLTNGVLHVRGEDGQEETIRLDQGEITAIGDDSLTLKENDGSSVTVKVDGDTVVMAPGVAPGKGSLDDLETGEEVTASGPQDEAAQTLAVVPSVGDPGKADPKAGPDESKPPAPPTKGSSGSKGSPGSGDTPSGDSSSAGS